MQFDHVFAAIAEPQEPVQPVLDRATRLAAAARANVVLFHAVFSSALTARPLLDTNRLARARGAVVAQRTRELEQHARALRERGIEANMHVVWEEPAYESIIRAAIRENADVVFAGPHARGRSNAPFSLRQTDWQLLRLCPRPLWLVRVARASQGPILVALDPTHLNDKPASLDAALLDAASSLGERLGVEVHAVHCVPDSMHPLDSSRSAREAALEKARKRLQKNVRKYRVQSSHVHVLSGLPEQRIPELARELDAQLIVMGAISRRGVKRFVIGDTAERLIDAAPCDLLIIKPAKFKLVLGRSRRERVILPQND